MRIEIIPTEKTQIKQLMEIDPVFVKLLGSTHSELDSWIDTNLETMDDMRALLKRLAKIVVFILRATA